MFKGNERHEMRFLSLFFIGVLATASVAHSQEAPEFAPVAAADVSLDDLLWLNRPVLLFAQRPDDPLLVRQLAALAEEWPALKERDVTVIVDSDPKSESDARTRIRPHGFMMVLLSKDGAIAQRKPRPWSARELIHAIDKMPLRIEEEKERRALNPRPMQ